MHSDVTFALLLESSKYLTSAQMRENLFLGAAADVEWLVVEGQYHHPHCSLGKRRDEAVMVTASLQDYWDQRCSSCPNPLHRYMEYEGTTLLGKAAMMLLVSRFDVSVPTLGMARTFREALGGLARDKPEAFEPEFLAGIQEKEAFIRAHLEAHLGDVLAEHAAVHVSAPRTGTTITPVPESAKNAARYYRKVATYWRRAKGNEIPDALAGLREEFPGDTEREEYAVRLFAALDHRFQAHLEDTRLQMVGIPEYHLRHMDPPLLGEMVRSTGKLVESHYFVETRPVVAAYLQKVVGVSMADFGVLNPEDSDAVREIARTLYAGAVTTFGMSDPDVEFSDPQGALEAARMLN